MTCDDPRLTRYFSFIYRFQEHIHATESVFFDVYKTYIHIINIMKRTLFLIISLFAITNAEVARISTEKYGGTDCPNGLTEITVRWSATLSRLLLLITNLHS